MSGDKHDLSYFAKCMTGGALACGLTHVLILPLDLVKCRRQVQPNLYKGIYDGFSKIKATEGILGLGVGWIPTLIGYSMQGAVRFGFYEIFKDIQKKIVGEENYIKYRVLGWSISAASGEFLADLFLCPFEALKVRMQTSYPPGVFPNSFPVAFNKIRSEEGFQGFYKGLSPLWCRQIPYTVVKFVSFEKAVELLYSHVFTKPKESYSRVTQLSITFASGYMAGILCAIVSHPADTIVSKLYNNKTTGSVGENIRRIYGEIGFMGLWRGLTPRIIMVGTLAALQWWIYDSFKTAIGLQTTGGVVVKKAGDLYLEKKF